MKNRNLCWNLLDMAQFSSEETMLREFCIDHDIPEFKVDLNLNDRTYDTYTGNKIYFSSEILGGDAFEKSEMLSVARKMATKIDDSIGEIIPESKKQKAFIYTRRNKLLKANFEDYFKQGRKKYYLSNREIRNKTIAVLIDISDTEVDRIKSEHVDELLYCKKYGSYEIESVIGLSSSSIVEKDFEYIDDELINKVTN